MAPRKKNDAVPPAEVPAVTPPAAPIAGQTPEVPVKPTKAPKNSVTVVNKRGDFVRKYDLATHGKDFEDLADEFATKFGHTVRDSKPGE